MNMRELIFEHLGSVLAMTCFLAFMFGALVGRLERSVDRRLAAIAEYKSDLMAKIRSEVESERRSALNEFLQ